MAGSGIPFLPSPGVKLSASVAAGIARVEVIDPESRYLLPWDRFMRLKVTSDHLRRLIGEGEPVRVLDVGGYDGALALFLSPHQVDLIDPATTGGSGLQIPAPDRAYDVVVSIDAIEHLPAGDRAPLLKELARVAKELCLINFPNAASRPAQELVKTLTGDPLVGEHLELGLPEKRWLVNEMEGHGFSCQAIPNTSLSLWVAQHTLYKLLPAAAAQVSQYLVRAHGEEPFSVPLYFLVICSRG